MSPAARAAVLHLGDREEALAVGSGAAQEQDPGHERDFQLYLRGRYVEAIPTRKEEVQ